MVSCMALSFSSIYSFAFGGIDPSWIIRLAEVGTNGRPLEKTKLLEDVESR